MFYLIRHGETDFSYQNQLIFRGRGKDFLPLSPAGIAQAEAICGDERLLDADLILSSPYTRTLQTAAIISRKLDIKLCVEPTLYEWVSDTAYADISDVENEKRLMEYNMLNGASPKDSARPWENNGMMKARMLRVLEKYSHFYKVIVICHGILMHAIFPDRWAMNAEIFKLSLEEVQWTESEPSGNM